MNSLYTAIVKRKLWVFAVILFAEGSYDNYKTPSHLESPSFSKKPWRHSVGQTKFQSSSRSNVILFFIVLLGFSIVHFIHIITINSTYICYYFIYSFYFFHPPVKKNWQCEDFVCGVVLCPARLQFLSQGSLLPWKV